MVLGTKFKLKFKDVATTSTTLTNTGLSIGMIFSEAVSSLYTVVARLSPMSEITQSSVRSVVITASLLPFLFNIPNLFNTIFSFSWIGIGLINILHIYSSFKAFRLLPSGPAMSIYFTYPILSALLAFLVLGRGLNYLSMFGILLAFIGVIMMGQIHTRHKEDSNDGSEPPVPLRHPSGNPGSPFSPPTRGRSGVKPIAPWRLALEAPTGAVEPPADGLSEQQSTGGSEILRGAIKEPEKLDITTEGIIWGLISALTEALIYIFVVSGGKMYDNFFLLMVALYFWPAIFGTGQLATQTESPIISYPIGFLIIANIILGVGGLTLQNALARLMTTGSYLSFSYLGVIFGYIYGVLMGDVVVGEEIFASLLILAGSLIGGVGY
jgi:drug/metabolite transporter (DMT)-like permease